ncbi:MAG: NAD-glutamate dehydrogenase, partial [Halomonas sp.]
SYAKSVLKGDLIVSEVPDDPVIERHVERIFPGVLAERYHDEMYQHRLKREIVATQVANDLVDHMGIVFARRLIDATGAGRAEIARAYVIAREVFQLGNLWEQIEALDNQVASNVQYGMMLDLMRLIRRATRWFLRSRLGTNTGDTIDYFAPRLAQIQEGIGERLRGEELDAWELRRTELIEAGVPEALAGASAAAASLYAGLGIIQAARQANENPQRVSEVYYEVGNRLELPWLISKITALKVSDSWQAQARDTFRDDVDRQQLALTVSVLRMEGGANEASERVDQWLELHAGMHSRWRKLLEQVAIGGHGGFPLFAVAVRELVDLAESSKVT